MSFDRGLDFRKQQAQSALLGLGQRVAHDGALPTVQRGQHVIDDRSAFGSDRDQQLAPVGWVRQAADEAAALERVEHRRHAAGRDDEPFGDDARFEGCDGAFEDGERLFGCAGQAMVFPRLPVVKSDQPVAGANEVRVALGGQPAGSGVLVLEGVVDDDPGRGGAGRGGTTRVVPPLPRLVCLAQEPVSS